MSCHRARVSVSFTRLLGTADTLPVLQWEPGDLGTQRPRDRTGTQVLMQQSLSFVLPVKESIQTYKPR